jgi:hypothetical protein
LHEHSWYFTDAPARWTASCGCGLAVEVTTKALGESTWEWTLDGDAPPADVMLDAIGSMTRVRRELLATWQPGRN